MKKARSEEPKGKQAGASSPRGTVSGAAVGEAAADASVAVAQATAPRVHAGASGSAATLAPAPEPAGLTAVAALAASMAPATVATPNPVATAASATVGAAPAEPPEPVEIDPLADFFVSQAERGTVDSYEGEGTGRKVSARDMLELLAFWVADEEYAVPIVEIQEIIKLPNVTVVPRAGRSVLGIISLRGTIVPVVDLRRILNLEERALTRQTRILVLQGGGDPIGILVDSVTSVVRLESGNIESTPRTMQRHDTELLRGVGRIGERLIIIIDVQAILSVTENAA